MRADPARASAQRDRLGRAGKPRVGLAWSGSALHRNDRNRSMALETMLPLIGNWAEFFTLQTEIRDADTLALASLPEMRLAVADLRDFADTAALVDLMDVVVTVDTSIAHLAGAMGKSVWILLPFNPDWRWLLDREDSVWYPTARLFRQPAIGDWDSVIRRVREELMRRFDLGIEASGSVVRAGNSAHAPGRSTRRRWWSQRV